MLIASRKLSLDVLFKTGATNVNGFYIFVWGHGKWASPYFYRLKFIHLPVSSRRFCSLSCICLISISTFVSLHLYFCLPFIHFISVMCLSAVGSVIERWHHRPRIHTKDSRRMERIVCQLCCFFSLSFPSVSLQTPRTLYVSGYGQ